MRRAQNSRWLCKCDCGNESIIDGCNLVRGVSQSCGCLRKEVLGVRQRTHGESHSAEFHCWQGMKTRCTNRRRTAYKNYGGRGIKVCERWLYFENFLADMGRRPGHGMTIERINNDGDYEPGNCRWAPRREQNRNSRQNVHLKFMGERKIVAEWSAKTGIKSSTIRARLSAGWSVREALTATVRKWGR